MIRTLEGKWFTSDGNITIIKRVGTDEILEVIKDHWISSRRYKGEHLDKLEEYVKANVFRRGEGFLFQNASGLYIETFGNGFIVNFHSDIGELQTKIVPGVMLRSFIYLPEIKLDNNIDLLHELLQDEVTIGARAMHALTRENLTEFGGGAHIQCTVNIAGREHKIYVKMVVNGETKYVTVKQAEKILAAKKNKKKKTNKRK